MSTMPSAEPKDSGHLLDQAAVSFLVRLPGSTRARVARLVRHWRPADAVRALAEGDPVVADVLAGCQQIDALRRSWQPRCRSADLDAEASALRNARVTVWWVGQPGWSAVFDDDVDPPAALFVRGLLSIVEQPRVAIVGTRHATVQGREMARLLGRQLADAGVAVVSGLALGIDAAAHTGALGSARSMGSAAPRGRPIAVVGSGLDIVYPRQNARLWEDVGVDGLLLSESPLGRGPIPAAFPERNRIIAQLGTVLVVVESHAKGGSLITVDRALERGRRVLAVPGSPLSLASAGTNRLLQGSPEHRPAFPCLGADDILGLLDLDRVSAPTYVDPRVEPSDDRTALLALMGWDPWTVGRLVPRSRLPVADVTLALAELEAEGWVGRTGGHWHRLATRPW